MKLAPIILASLMISAFAAVPMKPEDESAGLLGQDIDVQAAVATVAQPLETCKGIYLGPKNKVDDWDDDKCSAKCNFVSDYGITNCHVNCHKCTGCLCNVICEAKCGPNSNIYLPNVGYITNATAAAGQATCDQGAQIIH